MAPRIIRFFRAIGIVAEDVHKIDRPLVARSAGMVAITGIFGAIMIYIFVKTFVYNSQEHFVFLLAAMITMLLITLAGFIDDLVTVLDKGSYKEHESKFRLRQWQKPLLTLPAVIPLMVVLAGNSTIVLPLIGKIDLGILFPLIAVPIGVFGAANMVNLLEGLNGTASGMGLVYTGMLGLYALVHDRPIAAIIALSTFGSLLALWKFHKTPAKIHAGDSLTYLLGSVIACIAILGNMERVALIAATPFFVEFLLKLRGGFRKETLGYCDKLGKIHSRHDKIYSLPHLFMRKGIYTEKEIVRFLILIEFIFAGLIWII